MEAEDYILGMVLIFMAIILFFAVTGLLTQLEAVDELEKYCYQKNYAWNEWGCFKPLESGAYAQITLQEINGKTIEVIE